MSQIPRYQGSEAATKMSYKVGGRGQRLRLDSGMVIRLNKSVALTCQARVLGQATSLHVMHVPTAAMRNIMHKLSSSPGAGLLGDLSAEVVSVVGRRGRTEERRG